MEKMEESIKCHLVPNAKREGIIGEYDGRLKIAIAAPAIDGRANGALIEFIAKMYRVPKSRVKIVSGLKNRNKTIKIEKC
ncbi:MAG: DUF167 domain-containing protein [Rickettsiales bacterium]|jgi:uncharacterized protein (TIGR00251 family)|nr:DUF167 domain-containing protein [Rickettsiales bacterium]